MKNRILEQIARRSARARSYRRRCYVLYFVLEITSVCRGCRIQDWIFDRLKRVRDCAKGDPKGGSKTEFKNSLNCP